MEPDTEQDTAEYNLRLSRLRLSFKIKTRPQQQQQQQQTPDMPSRGEAAVHPAYRHAVASPTSQVNILYSTYNVKTQFVYLKIV